MAADLHIHSVFSDGSMTPEEIVKLAASNNIFTIAVSDHDTVEGVKYAKKAGEEYNVEIIPAIELSTFRGKAEIHILAYFIDDKNEVLLRKLKEIFQARVNRAKKMVRLLNEQGLDINFAEVKKIAGDDYIGRPHLARVMLEKGYIENIGEAFSRDYIGNDGKAYVSKYKISPEEGILLIKEAGGIPVVAHPAFVNHGDALNREDIKGLVEHGLMGIEVYQPKHSSYHVRYYRRIAEDLKLLITGGTDFHGENSPGIELGDVLLGDDYVDKLRKAYENNNL